MGGVAERLSTDQKGAIAEAAIAYAAIKLGIGVLKPLTDGHRYDLVFDLRDRLERVQCKWAPLERGAVVVRSYSCRRTATGLRKRIYSTSEIDAVVAYCHALDRCFYVPADRLDGHAQILLRVAPASNHQKAGVNWADDYRLEDLQFASLGP